MEADFIRHQGFFLLPLRAPDDGHLLGVLGVAAPDDGFSLSSVERDRIAALASRAALALEDHQLQQGIVGVLRQLTPQIESLQRLRSAAIYVGAPAVIVDGENPVHSPDFAHWVRDALSHYWGGPKLTSSPLLRLSVVRQALTGDESNAGKALRDVLHRAIEALRPDGERSLTANEWVLYNILDMKYVRGDRVRDIASRLAMSESDLYRKQRIAIDEVARQLAKMEEKLAQQGGNMEL